MTASYEIEAKRKTVTGTAESRRARHKGFVPGIIYGDKKDNIMVFFDNNQLIKALSKKVFHTDHILLKIEDHSEQVKLKHVHMHPTKPRVIHIDFIRSH